MGAAVGQIVMFAVAVAISPLAIVAVVLMLSSERGRANGPAFVLGWIAGLGAAGAVILALSSGADASNAGTPADWVNGLKLVLGVIAGFAGVRRWRERPRGGAEPQTPAWMQAVERFTPARSAGLGLALSAANPKNLLLAVAAATAIAQTGASTGAQIAALAIFVAIGTVGVGAPVALYFALAERSKSMLDELKDWMASNNNAIVAVILLLLAAKLIGDAISGYAA